ncbi:hypothetical protein ACLMAB_08225 [Brevibacillus laterosporus]
MRMKKLMKVTHQDAKFIDILCNGSLAEIMKEMDRFPEFKEEYEAYLDKFGDRCLDELKLESINLFDNPLPLLRSIGYLAMRSSPTKMGPSEEEIRRMAEEQAFKSIGFNLFRRVLFRWVLKNARLRVRDRKTYDSNEHGSLAAAVPSFWRWGVAFMHLICLTIPAMFSIWR